MRAAARAADKRPYGKYDVDVDGRGLIYIVDRYVGFDVLEFARG